MYWIADDPSIRAVPEARQATGRGTSSSECRRGSAGGRSWHARQVALSRADLMIEPTGG